MLAAKGPVARVASNEHERNCGVLKFFSYEIVQGTYTGMYEIT